MSGAFVARFSILKTFLGLGLGLAVLAVAWWGPQSFGLTPKPGWELIRWPIFALAALITIFYVRSLIDHEPQVRVDGDGVLVRHWSDEVIPWSAIARARVVRLRGRWPHYIRSVGFDLREPDRFPPQTFRGRLFGRSRSRELGDILVATVGLDRTFNDFVAAIRYHAPPDFELSPD